MDQARYHLIFEGFKPDTNKTALGYTLKTDLALTDAQLADLMAERRTVLKDNLSKEEALKLGKSLTQSGLIIKAHALAVNQKNNQEDLRKHLMDGGIEQYFASKYKHADDELDTQISLLVLAAFPVVCYLLLPFIGLLLLMPLLSFSIWTSQLGAALIQLLIASIFFIPLIWLRPRPETVEGIDLDHETEELMVSLCNEMAHFLGAPIFNRIVLVENPVLRVHQSPLQWLKKQATLELGLPVLEALNLQQFVGLTAMRMTPCASTFYNRTWGLFIQWYQALRGQYKPWAVLLDNWVLPMHEHQYNRGLAIARDVVGHEESLRLSRIDKKFTQMNRDWPEFVEFCKTLRVRGSDWHQLVAKEATSAKQDDEIQALFRMEAPSIWALSTTSGYQKSFNRSENKPLFTLPGVRLWQQFQRYYPHQERFDSKLIKPVTLVPPLEAPKKKNALNSLILNKQAQDVLNAQRVKIENALKMHAKPKKEKDVAKLIAKWRATSANFWPEDFQQHKLFPMAKALYLALQATQQLEIWDIDNKLLDANQQNAKDHKLTQLHQKWLEQIAPLPAFPLLNSEHKKLVEQLALTAPSKDIANVSAQEIQNLYPYWLSFLTIYWTYIVGQIFAPKTLSDEAEQATPSE
ncbi:hypothetical protein QWZ13_03225 [Reinekea marina]|uniref:Membrane protein DUF2207 n=1 Tax=Reinekea marina TaxID=1310421 RepID=A0ABV7WTR3_9GAMM|nr:hypothetical protein [Reinekea marina]MDN3647923.1 hypothetical protein [Reinekea marina]